MFRKTVVLMALAAAIACGQPGAAEEGTKPKGPLHEPFDKLLGDHVTDGVVDYKGLSKREAELDRYLAAVAKAKPKKLEGDERLTFWINAYNAFTLKLILKHYPKVTSITKLEKPWDTKEWKAGGELYSLNDIEHRVIRKEFAEPRIHFALVCAAKSCPDLRSEAYDAKRLGEQLEDQTRRFLADKARGAKLDGEKLRLSALFDWYGGDFVKAKGSVIDYVLPYLAETDRARVVKNRKKVAVEFLPYDWSLNGR